MCVFVLINELMNRLSSFTLFKTNKVMEKIETFPNPATERKYTITHVNPEFTSVCPKTGLPDFGIVTVNYVPDKQCLELKALKYYYFQYRNQGIFYEAITNKILDDLIEACKPFEMEIVTEWKVRGGMTSIIKANYTKSSS